MKCIMFPEATGIIRAPDGMKNCVDVHAFANGECIITAWMPTPEEIVKINMG